MKTGIIRWFNRTKGYGFIMQAKDGIYSNSLKDDDVFLHITVLEKSGVRYLDEGQQVQFEAEVQNGKLRAISVNI